MLVREITSDCSGHDKNTESKAVCLWISGKPRLNRRVVTLRDFGWHIRQPVINPSFHTWLLAVRFTIFCTKPAYSGNTELKFSQAHTSPRTESMICQPNDTKHWNTSFKGQSYSAKYLHAFGHESKLQHFLYAILRKWGLIWPKDASNGLAWILRSIWESQFIFLKSQQEITCISGTSITLQILSKEFNFLLKRGALKIINIQLTVIEFQHIIQYLLGQKASLTLKWAALCCLYGNAEIIPGDPVQR